MANIPVLIVMIPFSAVWWCKNVYYICSGYLNVIVVWIQWSFPVTAATQCRIKSKSLHVYCLLHYWRTCQILRFMPVGFSIASFHGGVHPCTWYRWVNHAPCAKDDWNPFYINPSRLIRLNKIDLPNIEWRRSVIYWLAHLAGCCSTVFERVDGYIFCSMNCDHCSWV